MKHLAPQVKAPELRLSSWPVETLMHMNEAGMNRVLLKAALLAFVACLLYTSPSPRDS